MSADDLREMRTDIKTILTDMATIKEQIKEAIPPCLYFKNHMAEHEKSRSAFGWIMSSILAPVVTALLSVYALLKLGFKP